MPLFKKLGKIVLKYRKNKKNNEGEGVIIRVLVVRHYYVG